MADEPGTGIAHDRATIQDAGDLFQREYIDSGTDGLKDLILGRIVSGGALARHEAELWDEVRASMDSTKVDRWLFQGDRSQDRPADLGYWMGYKICSACHARASDKKKSLADIIRMEDPARSSPPAATRPSDADEQPIGLDSEALSACTCPRIPSTSVWQFCKCAIARGRSPGACAGLRACKWLESTTAGWPPSRRRARVSTPHLQAP